MDTKGRKLFRYAVSVLTAVIFTTSAYPTTVMASEIGVIDTADLLDIHAEANDSSTVIGQVMDNSHIAILERDGSWVKIHAGDFIGWVPVKNLTETEVSAEEAVEANQKILAEQAEEANEAGSAEESEEFSAEITEDIQETEEVLAAEETEAVPAAEETETVPAAEETEAASTDGTVPAAEESEAAEEKRMTEAAQVAAAEAEAHRLAAEAEAQRLAAEAEAQRLAAEAEAQRLAAEAEAQRLAAEAEAQRLAAEAEAQRLAAEAEAQCLAAEAEAQRLAAEAEAQRLAAEAEAQHQAEKRRTAAYPISEEELYLLANIIYCEAGCEPYVGKVAVGNVIMNRVKSDVQPDTITEVVYAKGQFSPVRNGSLARALRKGSADVSCYQAAMEALAGAKPVGDRLFFRRVNGRRGQVIGHHVFW